MWSNATTEFCFFSEKKGAPVNGYSDIIVKVSYFQYIQLWFSLDIEQ